MKSLFLSLIVMGAGSINSGAQIQLMVETPPARVFQEIFNQTRWRADGPIKTLSASEFSATDSIRSAIFSEYGFNQVTSQVLKNGDRSITVEIFVMQDSPAAYGVFSFYRPVSSVTTTAPGNLAATCQDGLSFIQNKYYINLKQAGGEPVADLKLVSTLISKALPRGLLLPSLLSKLPEKGHVKNSTVYMMGPNALNRRIQGNGKDIFGMVNGAEALWAEYQEGEEAVSLLLLNYPTQQLAKQYLENGSKELMALFPDKNVLYKREGPLVTLVIGRSNHMAIQLLDQVNYVSSVSWDPKTKPLTVARLFLNVFLFIGISLLFTFGGGLLFGVVRIFARRFFPGKIFDRPGSELIHLDLQTPAGGAAVRMVDKA
jgi:hypothetical protein